MNIFANGYVEPLQELINKTSYRNLRIKKWRVLYVLTMMYYVGSQQECGYRVVMV